MTKKKSLGTAHSSQDLLRLGLIKPEQTDVIEEVSKEFSIALSPHVLKLLQLNNNSDQIAKQYVPSVEELNIYLDELTDPVGDASFTKVKGIVHRYPDRLLLKAVHVCPVYCRFCFRRESIGRKGEALSQLDLQAAFEYIRQQVSVWEVILSGGDPLILSDKKLDYIISSLNDIPHVEVIRVHTKFPIAEPSRITKELIDILKKRTAIYIIVHCNHPLELTEEASKACSMFIDKGIPVLSQTVLLKGINDDPKTLEMLMRTFVKNRIKPYYVHHLDLARGTKHFRTSIREGQNLMRSLRGKLSGLCQPTYVLDIPGGYGKVPIGHNYIQSTDKDGKYKVEDYKGNYHFYEVDNKS